MRTLIPFVVRIPQSTTRGEAERFAVVCNFAKEAPSSEIVETVIVALTPLPLVVVA